MPPHSPLPSCVKMSTTGSSSILSSDVFIDNNNNFQQLSSRKEAILSLIRDFQLRKAKPLLTLIFWCHLSRFLWLHLTFACLTMAMCTPLLCLVLRASQWHGWNPSGTAKAKTPPGARECLGEGSGHRRRLQSRHCRWDREQLQLSGSSMGTGADAVWRLEVAAAVRLQHGLQRPLQGLGQVHHKTSSWSGRQQGTSKKESSGARHWLRTRGSNWPDRWCKRGCWLVTKSRWELGVSEHRRHLQAWHWRQDWWQLHLSRGRHWESGL